jgi:ATP-dependent Lon protease
MAMTGELTLTGQVLPGRRHPREGDRGARAGIRELILPADNDGDFGEIPAHIRKGMEVHFAATFDDVVGLIFRAPAGSRRRG